LALSELSAGVHKTLNNIAACRPYNRTHQFSCVLQGVCDTARLTSISNAWVWND